MLSAAPTAPISLPILLALLAGLGVSSVTYWVLIRRATSHRKWVALSSWAREFGYWFQTRALLQLPEPFASLADPRPQARICLTNGRTTLLQMQGARRNQGMTARALQALHTIHAVHTEQSERAERAERAPPGGDEAPPGAPVTLAPPPATTPSGDPQWNVLTRRLEADWKPTGLRPAGDEAISVLDLFPLRAFPRMGGGHRFVVQGADAAAARVLGQSSVAALLPPDVGLLLHGHHLVLDFSTRPFDAIEFNRMRVLVDQVIAHLPAPPG
jgi:hypothetical protein